MIVVDAREIDWRRLDEQAQPCARDQQSQPSSGCREQKLFENDTADEPRAAGAERASNRRVPHSTQRPRERQVREVRARDQHDAADRAEQQPEPEPRAPDN